MTCYAAILILAMVPKGKDLNRTYDSRLAIKEDDWNRLNQGQKKTLLSSQSRVSLPNAEKYDHVFGLRFQEGCVLTDEQFLEAFDLLGDIPPIKASSSRGLQVTALSV